MHTVELDDLKKNQLVTLERGPTKESVLPIFNGEEIELFSVPEEQKSLNGVPLIIRGIELPYICVSIFGDQLERPMVLDSRSNIKFSKISKKYAQSFINRPKEQLKNPLESLLRGGHIQIINPDEKEEKIEKAEEQDSNKENE